MSSVSDLLRRYPDSALGLLGSVAVTVGTYGLADIPRNDATLEDLGLAPMAYGHGKTLSGIVFWLGVTLMVMAWVRIGRDREAMSLRATSATVLVWAAPLVFAIPVFSRDVYAYLGQAAVLADGFDPYNDGPAHVPGPIVDSMAQIWAPTTSPYSPAFMLLARGVVAVTGENVFAGVMAFRIVLLPGLLLALWAVPRIATHFGASRRSGLWLALLNPLLLIHLVGGPHGEMLLMGVLAAGAALVLGGRHAAGLVVLGLAVSLKVTAGVVVPFVVWIWLDHLRRERTVTARDRIGVFAATAAIPAAVFAAFTLALGLGFGWLNGLAFANRIINPFTLPTLAAHLIAWIASPFHAWNLHEVLGVTRTVGSVVMGVLLVYLWWRGRRDERAAMAFMCWAVFAVLVLEPSTLPWYYTWVTVLVVAFTLPMWARQVVVVASVVLLILFQPDDSILFYKPFESLLAVALGVLAAVSLRRRDPLRLNRFGAVLRGHG
ncbi:polyprenol phosphomannose-dependent alpha 1,6 mannosyltransferase MptB [Gordonia sp. HY366]|uniref:Polyprenol phosphomannose-dependent alpha 1,6 mannosyltransferase MptB n=1 Tax=Gordonia liuliyuniae TaxID=2911517 RepID=A0ABS9IUR0_9ACTN|nr:polyprenol phosphomannose-dependent alpha 1,6 mannosyltransferase MptB [Gordonia liuliyuniae]MCF8589303.1 polyprenol phosphomannose-dependent alpha 1,6 mannosyltransferase MptB [Gordonia liuliyuniae]